MANILDMQEGNEKTMMKRETIRTFIIAYKIVIRPESQVQVPVFIR